jgi:hypothetical protein
MTQALPSNLESVAPTPLEQPGDLELAKLRAEIAKTLAEAEKLKAETRSSNETWNRLWRKPAAWAAILPGIAAIAAALWQLGAGVLETKQREIAAQVKELDATRTLLKGDVAQLEAQKWRMEGEQGIRKDRLALQNEELELEQKKFATTQMEFEARKAEFEGRRDSLMKEKDTLQANVQSLKQQMSDLSDRVEVAAVVVPLKNILANPEDKSMKAGYSMIADAIRRAPLPKYRTALQDELKNASSKETRLQIKRLLLIGWHQQSDFDDLLKLFRNEPPELFIDAFAPQDWEWVPPGGRELLFVLFSDALDDSSPSEELIATLTSLCKDGCRLNPKSWQNPVTKARNIIVKISMTRRIMSLTLGLISDFHPYAARLLFSKYVQAATSPSRQQGWGVIFDLLDDMNGMKVSGHNFALLDEKGPSVNIDDKARQNWLASHADDLKLVVSEPASKWPNEPSSAPPVDNVSTK